MSLLPLDGFRPETAVAVAAVATAMRLASESTEHHDVSSKLGRDVVTSVDIAVEATIRSIVAEAFDMPSVGEEDGGTAPSDGSGYWLVDPICGTRNYALGIPLYCVNLALIEGGEVTVAVVGDPSTNEIAVAEVGRGAWALRVDARQSLAVSDSSRVIIVEEGKSTGPRRERAAAVTGRVLRADRWDLRSLGTTLSLPYFARGRVAAYLAFDLTAIHGAAGVLLATEAGATVSDIDGAPWSLASDSLLASATPHLHQEILTLVAGVSR